MSTAFIVRDGEIKAIVDTDLKNGETVRYSFQRCKEEMDANFDWNLVNALTGKISRAKKWKQYKYEVVCMELNAIEINPGDFYIESLYQEED